MRRKNRKWVAITVGLYLSVMVSAYRWGISQRMPEGNIFVKQEREGIRRLAEEKAKEAESAPKPTGETRLKAAGPAYVAARYDESHVVFIVTTTGESRFSSNPLIRGGSPTRISAPARPAAPLAGLQELWEPDSHSLHFFPKIIQTAQPGDQWTLSVSPDLTIPVAIDRAIIAPTGCSLALGFLASVAPAQQKALAGSGAEYFAVRRTAVVPVDPPVHSNISALPDWNASRWLTKIQDQLNDRLKLEVRQIDARLVANAGSPGAVAAESPMGSARPGSRNGSAPTRDCCAEKGRSTSTFTPTGSLPTVCRASSCAPAGPWQTRMSS